MSNELHNCNEAIIEEAKEFMLEKRPPFRIIANLNVARIQKPLSF